MRRRVLVTGGAGFIGSHFVRTLVAGGYPEWAGAEVVVLDKLTYAGNLANLAPAEGGFRFVHGDMIAAAYARTHGLPVTITRCGNNYGPYQYPEKIIPRFAALLMEGRTVPLYGDGGNVRNWIHVADHCAGIRLVADRGEPGEVYHIGGTAELTNRQLTQRLLDLFGLGWDRVEKVPDRKGHDRRYSLSDARLRALGYTPTISFEDGLVHTVEWYEHNRAWWRPLMRGRESR